MAAFALASSPLSEPPPSHSPLPTTSSQQIQRWKSPKQLSFELQQYVRIYFEESLFTKAFDLLLAVVTSDVSSQRNEVTVPPTESLALAATLAVHPYVTTRTDSEEKWAEAISALQLLQLLLKTVGPVNSGFKDSFTFKRFYDAAEDDDELDASIRHPFANEDSIWSRAEDFWSVVGWALNCSCLSGMYATRWEYWQPWLEFMIDVLHLDWQHHVSNLSSTRSMLHKYMSFDPGVFVQPRRFVRAIFADGSKNALNEFHEVFKRELKPPKQQSDKTKKREAVDIDREIYGDYLVQDDSDDSSENEIRTTKRTSTRNQSMRRITPRSSRQSLRSDLEEDGESSSIQGLGPPSSINIRLRLMQLLINTASQPGPDSSHPSSSSLSDLFILLVEFIKPLPLGVFQQITSPAIDIPINHSNHNNNRSITPASVPPLSLDAHTTLLEFLLQHLLENTPPPSRRPTTLEPLSQPRLETDYLPHAAIRANSIDAQARVSLCLEGLMRNLARVGALTTTATNDDDALARAVEDGVERRLAKVHDRIGRVKDGSPEEDALGWLLDSSARMRDVIRRLNKSK